MKHLIDDVRAALKGEAWHAALALALALPDVCGYLETGDAKGSERRYVRWFKRNLEAEFTYDSRYFYPFPLPGDDGRERVRDPFHIEGFDSHIREVFLTGKDCYALRCAYLHLGDFDVTQQRVRDVLARFTFIAPLGGGIIHMNRYPGKMLQLQVDLFCESVCIAVESWLTSPAAAVPDVAARILALPQVQRPERELT